MNKIDKIELIQKELENLKQEILNCEKIKELLKKSVEEIRHLKSTYRDNGHCVKFINEAEKAIKYYEQN